MGTHMHMGEARVSRDIYMGWPIHLQAAHIHMDKILVWHRTVLYTVNFNELAAYQLRVF